MDLQKVRKGQDVYVRTQKFVANARIENSERKLVSTRWMTTSVEKVSRVDQLVKLWLGTNWYPMDTGQRTEGAPSRNGRVTVYYVHEVMMKTEAANQEFDLWVEEQKLKREVEEIASSERQEIKNEKLFRFFKWIASQSEETIRNYVGYFDWSASEEYDRLVKEGVIKDEQRL